MPFDPIPTEIEHDGFTLGGLIAWLETQNPSTEYDYCDLPNCLLNQWARARGFEIYAWAGRPDHANHNFCQVASGWPQTFGAALKRARKIRGY